MRSQAQARAELMRVRAYVLDTSLDERPVGLEWAILALLWASNHKGALAPSRFLPRRKRA